MDPHFNLDELTDTIDGLVQDDFYWKHNISFSRTVHEFVPYCASSINDAPTNSSREDNECNFALELQRDNVQSSEEVIDENAILPQNSNAILRYIRQWLLEEDINENKSTYGEEFALLATEKVFHDILRQEYYSSPEEHLQQEFINQISYDNNNHEKSIFGGERDEYHERPSRCQEEHLQQESTNQISSHDSNHEKSISGAERELMKNISVYDIVGSQELTSASDNLAKALPIESTTAQQIQKGAEEAMKFLPNIGEFFINRDSSGSISGGDCQSNTKKSLSYGKLDKLVGRASKQIVAYCDEPIRNEIFDKAFLHGGLNYIEDDPVLREIVQNETRYKSRKTQGRISKYAMKRDKNHMLEEPVNLISLLIHCSQAVSGNDHPLATELISKIRKHSSASGNWSQRLASCFVIGLEARLAGTGSEIYRKMLSEKPSTIDILKAYRAYLVSSPYMRVLIYYTNQTILNNIPRHAKNVHIINYGVVHGFQWPPFFEHFANWGGTPPKIRITMIEVPESGFRPRKRVELIGRRLADYANSFNVPFEYKGIASKWENVNVEDLKISNNEIVIVNCAVNSERLSDESIDFDTPRDIVLKTIRKIKPRIFIHGTKNGSFNSPFFLDRFRSALLHYSSMFEMLESNLPRDSPDKLIIERNALIPDAINVIACEGSERVKRPETYKQWHARKLRAGLVPFPIDETIKKKLKDFVRRYYQKEFSIDDDYGWLLLSWKGRIMYAMSAWKSSEV